MDPQRQYAQLLTLWSQGSKVFRRARHYNGWDRADRWDAWWKLGRRLVERGLTVVPLPLIEGPALMVGFPGDREGWLSLADVQISDWPLIFPGGIGVCIEGPALGWTEGGLVVNMSLLRRQGQRGLQTLSRIASAKPFVSRVDRAETLLAAYARFPEAFSSVPAQDWSFLAFLWRHRGESRPYAAWGEVAPSPWVMWDARTRGFRWSQDEDSVHMR